MTISDITRINQSNGSGDARALALKVFAGEVITAFQRKLIFKALTDVRQIASGKSASFPIIGSTTAAYHEPGTELAGRSIKQGERIIPVDKLCIAHTYIPNIDEALAHFDVRGPYAVELGAALARAYDERLARMIAKAARTSRAITDPRVYGGTSGGIADDVDIPTDGDGGSDETANPGSTAWGAMVRDPQVLTVGSELMYRIWNALQILDEKDVPEEGRTVALKPAQYYLLLTNASSGAVQAPFWISKDYDTGGGSLAQKKVPMIGKAEIVMTNSMPTEDVVDDVGGDPSNTASINNYNLEVDDESGNCMQAALVFQKNAVGTVELLGLQTENEYKVSHQATLMVAKYAVGHGVINPACAVEVTAADLS